ncbi:MAG: hypothetical protein WBK51_12860 [Polaromonas sp.]
MSNDISSTPAPKFVTPEQTAIDSSTKLHSLDDMLASFDPKHHGGEAMAFLPAGREVIPTV